MTLGSSAGGTAPGVRAAAGTSTPRTGSAGPRGTSIIWPALPASPARGSCQPGRSSLWWRRRCSAGFTTTACWTTSSGRWRKVCRPDQSRSGCRFKATKKKNFFFFFSFLKIDAAENIDVIKGRNRYPEGLNSTFYTEK